MRKIMFRGQTRRFGVKIKNYAGEPMESAWVFGYGAAQGNGDFSIIYGSEKGPDTIMVPAIQTTAMQKNVNMV